MIHLRSAQPFAGHSNRQGNQTWLRRWGTGRIGRNVRAVLRVGDSPWVKPVVVGVLGVLAFLAAANADSRLDRLVATGAWRDVQAPLLVTYLVAIQPLLGTQRRAVVTAFEGVLPVEVSTQLHVKSPSLSSWSARIAIGVAVAVVMLEDGWFRFPIADSWLNGYYHVLRLVLFALIGWAAYCAWDGTRLGIRLQQSVRTLDMFNLEFLDTIGRHSLSVLVIFIGGITFSVLFVPLTALTDPWNLVIYPGLVLLTLGLFLWSIRGTHALLSSAKRAELVQVRQQLSEAYAAWSDKGARDTAPSEQTVTVLLAWERRLLETPEWPWNAGLVRGLSATLLAPLVAVAVRLLLGYAVWTLIDTRAALHSSVRRRRRRRSEDRVREWPSLTASAIRLRHIGYSRVT